MSGATILRNFLEPSNFIFKSSQIQSLRHIVLDGQLLHAELGNIYPHLKHFTGLPLRLSDLTSKNAISKALSVGWCYLPLHSPSQISYTPVYRTIIEAALIVADIVHTEYRAVLEAISLTLHICGLRVIDLETILSATLVLVTLDIRNSHSPETCSLGRTKKYHLAQTKPSFRNFDRLLCTTALTL